MKRRALKDPESLIKKLKRSSRKRQACVDPLLGKPVRLVFDELHCNDPCLCYKSVESQALDFFQSFDLESYLAIRPIKPLWTFQREAVNFCLRREEDSDDIGCKGGMLCDQMGLGKSKDMLCLVLEQNQAMAGKTKQRFNGTTLLVCTNILIQHWLREMQSFAPQQAFQVLELHGAKKRLKLAPYYYTEACDIVLTTYSTLATVHRQGPDDARHAMLFGNTWHRVIADEADIFVVPSTENAKAMFALKAHHRWIVTGTPLHNRKRELWTLMRFVAPLRDSLPPLQQLMLRRLKRNVPQGEAAPEFQSVTRHVELVALEPLEKLLYQLYAMYALQERRARRGSIPQLIHLLRQLCINPAVIKELALPPGMLVIGGGGGGSQQQPLFRHVKNGTGEIYHFMNSLPGKFSLKYCQGEAYQEDDLRQAFDSCNSVEEFIDDSTVTWDPWVKNDLFSLDKEEDRILYKQLWDEMVKNPGTPPQPTNEKTMAMLKHLKARTLRLDRPFSTQRRVLEYVSLLPIEEAIVIFSFYAEVLKDLEKALKAAGHETVLVTGSENLQNNEKALARFENGKGAASRVLLMTLKLGKAGLNLLRPSQMIFTDPWWCPAALQQAENRLDRPGQQHPITISYFIGEGTIEQYMMNYTLMKKALLDNLPSAGEGEEEIVSDMELEEDEEARSRLFDYTVTLL
jgi:SNF2 family DNA or RNA helicase